MFQRKSRRFRRRSNGRNFQSRGNGVGQVALGSSALSSIRGRNNFNSQQSAEKLTEKYKALAKEAMSSGDKTLSESYLQHADHFMRIVNEKNITRNQNKIQSADKPIVENKHLDKNNEVEQIKTVEIKEEKKE